MPVETLTFRADLAQLHQELSKLPNVTEKQAKGMVAALEKGIKDAEKAAKKHTKALQREAKKTGKGFDDAFGKAASSASKLSGGLGAISPELESLSRGATDFFDAMEVGAGVSLGPLAAISLAVGGIAVVYAQATAEVDRINAARKHERDLARSLIPVTDSLKDAQLDLAIAMGTISELEGEIEKIRNRGARQVREQSEGLQEQRNELQRTIESNREWKETLQGPWMSFFTAGITQAIGEFGGFEERASEAEATLTRLNATTVEHAEKTSKVTDILEELAEQRHKDRAAIDAHTSATETNAEAQRQLLADVDAVRAIYDKAASTHQDASTKIIRARNEELDRLDELMAKYGGYHELTEEIEEARVAVIESASAQVAEIRAKELADAIEDEERLMRERAKAQRDFYDGAAKLADKARTEEEERAAMTKAAWMQTARNVADMSGMAADALAGKHKKAAKAFWNVTKGLRAGEVMLSAQVAAMAALQPPPVGLGPATGGALAATTLALGAANAAATLATPASFDTGREGFRGPGALHPDETTAVVRKREHPLTPQGVAALGGPRGVQEINRGAVPGGQPLMAVFKLDHKVITAINSQGQARTPKPGGRRNPYRSR